MIVTLFHDYEVVKKLRTSTLVRIFFDRKGKNTDVFYLSAKQLDKLHASYSKVQNSRVKDTHGLVVIDDDRFVWSGVEFPDYSDRENLCKHFSGGFSSIYEKVEVTKETHTPEEVKPVETKPNDDLVR